MTTLWISFFVAVGGLCAFLLWKVRKQATRIDKLESAILGKPIKSQKTPYESLLLLSSLRLQASRWLSSDADAALLSSKPAFIEMVDDYICHSFNVLHGEYNSIEKHYLIDPRPPYSSLYITNNVIFWLDSKDEAKRTVTFPCVSREEAERIVSVFDSHGIKAQWTSTQTYPAIPDKKSVGQYRAAERAV